nr:immunoglobulin heavy chain junction region [Mus musculus]
YCAGFGS